MKKHFQNIHGGALLITLAIMLMLTVAAIMAVHTAQTDMDLSFNQLHHDQSFYVAEAGLKRAFVTINDNNLWEDPFLDSAFENGTYTVIFEREIAVDSADFDPIKDTIIVRSTGVMQEAAANVRAIIVPELLYPFDFAVFGDDFIVMDNSSLTDSWDSDGGSYDTSPIDSTDGDVASNGTITLDQGADVCGDVSTSTLGGITIDSLSVDVYGSTSDAVDPYELEHIPDSVWTAVIADNSNSLIPSPPRDNPGANDLTLSTFQTLTLTAGTYYFEDVLLDANSSLLVAADDTVFLYINGDLQLYNNTSINTTQNPANCVIFSRGTVETIGMDTDIHAAFYGPDAVVTLDNSCDWYGSIIAASVTLENSAEVHYDQALTRVPTTTTGNMLMIAWAEE